MIFGFFYYRHVKFTRYEKGDLYIYIYIERERERDKGDTYIVEMHLKWIVIS